MSTPRLTADFWISAYLARLRVLDIPAFIVAKGDPTAGSVIVKLTLLDGTATVFSRAYGPDGESGWARLTGEEPAPDAEAEALIRRQREFDPDIWVVEVEDRAGRPELDDPIF